MNKKIIVIIAIILFLAASVVFIKSRSAPNIHSNNTYIGPHGNLSGVRVAILYESVTQRELIGTDRNAVEIAALLKETHADMIFRGFWRWLPPPNSPDGITPALTEYYIERTNVPAERIPELAEKSGYNYRELERKIAAIKKERTGIIFVGAIPAQRINRIDKNDMTDRLYTADETWSMALDPQKWNITQNGKPVTKEDFQKQFATWHGWIKSEEEYNRNKVEAYFPDITNPKFQETILGWAEKQIDCGADAIWIDGMPITPYFYQITKDFNHPAIKDSYESSRKIIDEIHKYGESKGKRVYVGSWGAPSKFVDGLLYIPDNIDFVTMSPTENEIANKKLDESYKKISRTKILYPDKPIFAFIDWGVDRSQTVAFSQELNKKEQAEMLEMLDESFAKQGVNFVYPVHGGYMGRGDVTTKLAFGKYRDYDSLAPEFNTYETIKELANKKSHP